MQPDAFRPEVAAFIEAQPRAMGYSQLAEACRARFGDTAPNADAIRAWWLSRGPRPDPRARIPNDPEIAAAINDMAGRMTPAEILLALRCRFRAGRVPRRSTLYRHISDLLSRSALAGR
jgi:hypothetical protein